MMNQSKDKESVISASFSRKRKNTKIFDAPVEIKPIVDPKYNFKPKSLMPDIVSGFSFSLFHKQNLKLRSKSK
jgi:hypothetical protein